MAKVTAKPGKSYRVMWLDNSGEVMYLPTVVTNNPSETLFNLLCGMMVTAATFFHSGNRSEQQIRKLIKKLRDFPEHHCAEINGQVLSLIEITNKNKKEK